MKQKIIDNIDNPQQLEKLYQEDKVSFKREFNLLYPGVVESERSANEQLETTSANKTAVKFWHARLNYVMDEVAKKSKALLIFTLLACFFVMIITGTSIESRTNFAFIYVNYAVYVSLISMFAWQNKMSLKRILIVAGVLIASFAFFILTFDDQSYSRTELIVLCLPLFLWSVLGVAFVGKDTNNYERRLDYLKFNSDLIIMSALIFVAGILLTLITLAFFNLIKIHNLDVLYIKYIVAGGSACVPIVGSYLVLSNQKYISKISTIIAKLFMPLILITLTAFLCIFPVFGTSSGYYQRENLMTLNIVLICVLAIMSLLVAGTGEKQQSQFMRILLLLLSVVTILLNCIALFEIMSRLTEWGITQNRIVVIGSNLLMLINLCLVAIQQFKGIKNRQKIINTGKSIGQFLPIYGIWVSLILFVFPFVFS